MTTDHSSERVLVLAPAAGDGPAVGSFLNERGFVATVCQDLTEMCAHLAAGAGALLLAEEALELAHTPDLLNQLKAQPPWSEIPVIILTRGGESHLSRLLDLVAQAAGGVSLLERPLSTVSLQRSVEVALRSRRRQYQLRGLIEEQARIIAEQIRAKEGLRESNERFQRLTDASIIGIITANTERITSANDEFLRLVGYTRADLDAGKIDWRKMTPAEFAAADKKGIAELRERGCCQPFEKEYWRKDGSRVPILIGASLLTPNPLTWICFVLDLTQLKQKEQRILEQGEALRRVEKIAAAGQLASALAHEINNPLACVTNALYLLEQSRDLTQEARNLVTTAASELGRVARIVRQSLAYYRVGSVPTNLDLSAIVEESLQIFSNKLKQAGIKVTKRLTPDAQILGFSDEVRQVIDNLLLNAVEASPRGGRLVVSVRLSRDWRNGKPGVRLTVGDTGSGIRKENMSRIFEPFFTTKFEKGTGLGLWVVHGIVTKHEGSIRIRSAAGSSHSGTAISILWPSQSRTQRASRADAKPAA